MILLHYFLFAFFRMGSHYRVGSINGLCLLFKNRNKLLPKHDLILTYVFVMIFALFTQVQALFNYLQYFFYCLTIKYCFRKIWIKDNCEIPEDFNLIIERAGVLTVKLDVGLRIR